MASFTSTRPDTSIAAGRGRPRAIRWSSLAASPWKNGGGITHEAWRDPARGEPFRARASIARVAAAGPFSDFAGYRRFLVLLEGDGLALQFAGGECRELRHAGQMIAFDGGVPVAGRLLGGPTVDFNLMLAHGEPDPGARVLQLETGIDLPAAPLNTRLIFCLSGRASLHSAGAAPLELDRWDLGVAERAEAPLRIDGDGAVFVAQV